MNNFKISDVKQMITLCEKDPWDLDFNAGKQAFSGLTGGGAKFGKVCPLKNYKKPCKVCEKAVSLFNTGTKQDEVIARKIYAKKQCFWPVWIPSIEKKPFILHTPVSVAEEIMDGVYNTRLWGNIFHPVKGRIIYVSKIPPKTKDDWVSYRTTPDPEGTHKLPNMKILEYVPDMDKIIDKLEKEETDGIKSLRDILEPNESLKIRFLPDPKHPSHPPLRIVWTHYIDDVTLASLEDTEVSTDELMDDSAPFDTADIDEIPDFEGDEGDDEDIFA
ncbi:MAG: DNA polymerase V family protein [Canidatus Methanoxibalbensis ujae]|nr:DNA polymerase V family protein [Candidatus Methanoxibalbensis ujae]